MKLSTETYKQGMKILANHYLDWKFDLTNSDMVAAWYATLSGLISEQDFIAAVKYYTSIKAKGPTSPVELQETYLENVPQLSPMEALSTLLGLLTLYSNDDNADRLVEILTSIDSNRALYLTYCNMAYLGEISYSLYPNARLKEKFEDSYICTWFISEYKRIQKSVIREACISQINALPSGSDFIKIGG